MRRDPSSSGAASRMPSRSPSPPPAFVGYASAALSSSSYRNSFTVPQLPLSNMYVSISEAPSASASALNSSRGAPPLNESAQSRRSSPPRSRQPTSARTLQLPTASQATLSSLRGYLNAPPHPHSSASLHDTDEDDHLEVAHLQHPYDVQTPSRRRSMRSSAVHSPRAPISRTDSSDEADEYTAHFAAATRRDANQPLTAAIVAARSQVSSPVRNMPDYNASSRGERFDQSLHASQLRQ
jgi:hypothetical protein